MIANRQDHSTDAFSPVTRVQAFEGPLYLGSLTAHGIARLPVPDAE